MSFNFGRKVKRMARRQMRHGNLDRKTYDKIAKGSKNPDVVAMWKDAVERRVPGPPWLAKTGVAQGELLSRIWEWFKDNWPLILRLLLSALIFLAPAPSETRKEIRKRPEKKSEKKSEKERENVDS